LSVVSIMSSLAFFGVMASKKKKGSRR
jgi:hypothetical protein